MTVMVPFSNAADIGLRRVTKDREISRILSFLSNGWCSINPDWKVRFKENTDKMQSGDLLRAAEVFKGLLQIHVEKPLSFREKKMLDRARHMLVSEISIAREVSEIHAAGVLQRSLDEGRVDAAGESVGDLKEPGDLPFLRPRGPKSAC
jgi:CarD family transcriptional regulator